MKTKIFYYAIALLAILALNWTLTGRPARSLEKAGHPSGVASFCFDGDTLKLADRRIVRLAGIDAPEMPHRHQGAPGQYYAREAKNILNDMVRGQKVNLSFPGVKTNDAHGRLVAEVMLEDGTSLNRSMVEQGAAFFYPHQDLNPEFQQELKELQAEAINERRGLWAHLLSLPLAQRHYIGNKNTLRFFPADCPDIEHIKPRNRISFGNLMDAFLAGYAPARTCIFWPSE